MQAVLFIFKYYSTGQNLKDQENPVTPIRTRLYPAIDNALFLLNLERASFQSLLTFVVRFRVSRLLRDLTSFIDVLSS